MGSFKFNVTTLLTAFYVGTVLIHAQAVNVALNASTSQYADLDFADFLWTSDRAVDGCVLQDDPDNQGCCSGTTGTTENYWMVDLAGSFNISRIVVYGRDVEAQTTGFRVTINNGTATEEQVYDNAGVLYGNGIFTINLDGMAVESVTITRPTEGILILCEVEVYEVCPHYTYGDNCTSCGNCANQEVCDKMNGTCPGGCAAGWEGPMCTTASTASPNPPASTTHMMSVTTTTMQQGSTTMHQGSSAMSSGSTMAHGSTMPSEGPGGSSTASKPGPVRAFVFTLCLLTTVVTAVFGLDC